MTLLLAALAASVSTLVWYLSARARRLGIGSLVLMYWGITLMWLVDTTAAFLTEGAACFQLTADALRSEALLGCSALVLGIMIWLAGLLLRDPDGVLRARLRGKA